MTDGHVYAVASGKGGVGKTTTAVNLAAGFAEAGRSVVVVDVDLGMANLDDFLEVDPPEATIHAVLAGDADIETAISEAPGGFDVVLGSPEIEAFGRADPAALRDLLPTLREQYDLVLLDGGGGLSHDMTVPLGLADEVIVVTTPADAAITNASKTMALVDRLGTDVAGLIVTRLGGAGRPTPETVGEQLDLSVLGSVPEDGAIQMSANEGVPLMTIDRQSPAAQAYREMAYSLVDEPLPRDWADEEPHAIDQAMGGDEQAEAEPPEEDSEETTPQTADDEEGIADRLERMEDDQDAAEEADPSTEADSETQASSGVESEPASAGDATEPADNDDSTGEKAPAETETEQASGSIFSRLFGGLFG